MFTALNNYQCDEQMGKINKLNLYNTNMFRIERRNDFQFEFYRKKTLKKNCRKKNTQTFASNQPGRREENMHKKQKTLV